MLRAVVLSITMKISDLQKGHTSVSLNLPNFAKNCVNTFVQKELDCLPL